MTSTPKNPDTLVNKRKNPAGENDPKLVIFASSLGTVFEWYDFFIYASLAAFFGQQFFPVGDATAAILANLAILGAGFAARPIGAIIFGHMGDILGRKHTFLVTITLMGGATALVGILPTYAQIGILAPILLVSLRLIQGLALGGEYGGAAIYVAEHAPDNKRGAYTGWIQITAGLGFLMSLLVILATRKIMGEDAFGEWGWRIPFLLSVFLLAISIFVRLKLNESPIFAKMKAEGTTSKAPLKEVFTNKQIVWRMVTACLGANAGQGVLWYTAQIYALYFMTTQMKITGLQANIIMIIVVIITTPLFAVFGWLSDKMGRKTIMAAGLIMGAIAIFPTYQAMARAANPALVEASENAPVTMTGPNCPMRIMQKKQVTECGQAKAFLANSGVSYTYKNQPGADLTIMVGNQTLSGFDKTELASALKQAGYPDAADPARTNVPKLVALIVFLTIFATMTYGPIAAFLVELFPARVRYSALSIPYHMGSGVIGGFTPFISFAIMTATGNIYAGLWYPVLVAGIGFVINILTLPETRRVDIRD